MCITCNEGDVSAMAPAKSRGAGNEHRRGGGPKRVPALLARLLTPAARRRGLVDARLVSDWATIVGAVLAGRCQPIKLGRERDGSGGVLHLRVTGGAALELQHGAPQVIERINDHFGYPAVARLRIVQAPLHRTAPPPAPTRRALGEGERAAIDGAVAGVADPGLRAALARLGYAVATGPLGHDRR